MPNIPALRRQRSRKIAVGGQIRQKVHETPSQSIKGSVTWSLLYSYAGGINRTEVQASPRI
jgi:hypothetical protein